MDYIQKLYAFAMKHKCSYHLYIDPNGYKSAFLYSKEGAVIDYWSREEDDNKPNFTVGGLSFYDNYDEAIKQYEKLLNVKKTEQLILEKGINND